MTPGLTSGDRRLVCLIGKLFDNLKQEFEYRNLNIVESTLDEAVARCGEGARAVLVPPSQASEVAKTLGHLLRPTLDHGAAIYIVAPVGDLFAAAHILVSPEQLARKLSISIQSAKLLPVKAINGAENWERIAAQLCLTHDPGRGFSDDSKIMMQPESEKSAPDDQNAILIRRAFSDFEQIHLTPLHGKKLPINGPWRVSARRQQGRELIEFVVKTGTISGIGHEIFATQTACFDHMAFPHYPPVVEKRCTIGSERRAIVSMFVERAILFEEYILSHSPALAITALFDGPLRRWRRGGGVESVSIGRLCKTRRTLPPSAGTHGFNVAWRRAHKDEPEILPPHDLLGRLLGQPLIRIRKVQAHGDLHLRNIFVRQNSADVVLIDFRKTSELPASIDPATLDTSFGFDIPRVSPDNSLVPELLFELYKPPLLGRPFMLHVGNHRAEAIQHVRRQISDSVTELEYQLAVSSYLLWHAWWKRNPIAYRCASRILSALPRRS